MTLRDCRNIEDLRLAAMRRLPKPIFDFLEGGAEDEWTARQNVRSFDHYPLVSRTLVDVQSIDTRTRLLGQDIAWPVIAAPTGASALFHYTGEAAVANAAAACGTIYTMSTMSTQSLESVGRLNGSPKIFQIYVFRDRALTEALVERCRAAGYAAICLTVDTPVGGNRERDRANGMSMPPRLRLKTVPHFALRPGWCFDALLRSNFDLANFRDVARDGQAPDETVLQYVDRQFDRSVTWNDAAWLARQWGGQFVVKGILSADDARRAVDIGASAIWLSNHGGRQLDGMSATIDALADIRQAVGADVEIILDGGVRRGTHVIKAIALGATACGIGRPYLYGLAAGGQRGVAHAFDILRKELERDMALAGCPTLKHIDAETLANHRAQ
ncbi:MAG: alpha-hydroxy acid oxidase [Gammaproteobacteria bacterium]|nr:alpha-hydroxy acid oxidase [Gammaproteobacteria bacterium]